MRKIESRGWRWRARQGLLALCGLVGGLFAAPAGAQSFYENNRSYYFGMGDLRTAGGMVDVPTGALRLRVGLPPLPGRVGHEIACYFTGQDASSGPLGKGTSLSVNAYFVDTGNGLDLIMAGHRRFRFTLQYEPTVGHYIYKASRDPEMLGASFDPAGGPLTGWLTFKSKDRLYFNAGILTEIQDRHGASVYLAIESPSGRCVSVQSTANFYPRAGFGYDGIGRLTSITYQYQSAGDPNNRVTSRNFGRFFPEILAAFPA